MERCLYIYFSLENNYNELNVIIKKVFQHPIHTSLTLVQRVHKDPFLSHLYLPTFSSLHTPTTLTGRHTLNHPKPKVPSPPAHSQNSANASTTTPSSNPLVKRKKGQTNNCGTRTCYSGL